MWETSPDVDIKGWRPFPQITGAINLFLTGSGMSRLEILAGERTNGEQKSFTRKKNQRDRNRN